MWKLGNKSYEKIILKKYKKKRKRIKLLDWKLCEDHIGFFALMLRSSKRKGVLMEIWKSLYMFIKIIPWKFRILNPDKSRVIYPWNLRFS